MTIENKYIPGIGPLSPKLMVIGEAPSYKELEAGKPFVGPAGSELDKLFKDSGLNRNEVWLTNVCKFFVPFATENKKIPFHVRAKNYGIDLEQQKLELFQEIKEVNPNCLLILGATALQLITGNKNIDDWRGSILWAGGRKAISTYHPAHLIHQQGESGIKGYWKRQVMIFDFKRAKRQSEFPELILPTRNLHICKSSYQLSQFIERYKNAEKLSIDIEAGGTCIPICIGLAFNDYEGICVSLWDDSIPSSDLANCWILLAELLINPRFKKIGQNFKYDQDKIRRLGFVIDRLHSDTMLKAFAINPELPKNLGFNTSLYTEEPFYKHEGMYHGELKDLFIGCARDACVTWEIDTKMDADLDELGMRPYYENFIMHLHEFYLDMETIGFRVDNARREELLRKYIEWMERINYELFQHTGTFINVNSPKQIAVLLWENLRLPRKLTTGEEDLTALIQSPSLKNEDHKRILELILEGRRVSKTKSTYVMALPDYDGRMKTTFFPCLETGRSSTGQLDPPIRPAHDKITGDIATKKTNNKSIGMAFQTITKHGDIGEDIRSMFVVDEEEVFLQADSSQAEARVVALLANDDEMMRMYDEHDIHALTASWFFGGTEQDYSKKVLGYESPIRFAGKTLRHAGNLGASKRRASIELNTQARKYKIPLQISEADAGRALEIFHSKSPSIRKVFHTEVIAAITKNRRLIAPLPYGVDAPHGGVRIFYERYGEELFRQAFSYLPQRAVSDNTKNAGMRIKRRIPGIKIILEAHDALLFSVPVSAVNWIVPIIRQEMERPIDFSACSLPRRALSIPCDIEIGTNYQELKKFKFEVAA